MAATLLPCRRAPLPADLNVLPIEEAPMPADDVSDLKDVFDAINRLCETMRTSTYDEVAEDPDDVDEVIDTISSNAVSITETIIVADPEVIEAVQIIEYDAELTPVEVSMRTIEAYRADRWSDALVSPPTDETDTLASDTEHAIATCEPASEMYYTASSEVSLLSDLELPERPTVDEQATPEDKDKEEKKECVISGHVAAMRERFESMTRANTPCPDLARPASPSFDVFRNITPSPDGLG